MQDENELTPEEEMAFQRLPKEKAPSDLLEERVVRSLREEGLLASPEVPAAGLTVGRDPGDAIAGSGRRRAWLRPWLLAGGLAASLVLFVSGLSVGQWLGSRNTAEAFLAVREQDAEHLALRIQEAGSAYVAALAALSDFRGGPIPGEGQTRPEEPFSGFHTGQEVALGTLFGAAMELARMAPDDADIHRVLQILEDRKAREEGREIPARNVIWF